ncbi:hypothetical protein [Achromobacter insolitus]|uniref:hypothetical protein n=1 Tax=Achromobacter insolitus TaxID=217204 RepID=UPI0017491DA0|nr:hypothetical protein [Achromobacter insolitus]
MSIEKEFQTVDLVADAGAVTSSVDAFALSVIKAERQIRRLFTHIVFQCPAFGPGDVSDLRNALWERRQCYFEGFVRGIDGLLPVPLDQLIGVPYHQLRLGIDNALLVRNKLFHGQLTDQSLCGVSLLEHVGNVRGWCQAVADAGIQAVGYDGFQRNSFRKGEPEVYRTFQRTVPNLEEYGRFLDHWVVRRQGWQPPAGW